jgi:hypothetical protein
VIVPQDLKGHTMKHGLHLLALAGSVALLAGCGGGGSDSTVNTFLDLDAEARAAAEGYIDPDTGALASGVSERTNLPQSGSADYNGYVKGDLEGEGLVGELALKVDFSLGDNGTITGTADNFQHETEGAYAGTLDLENGLILPGLTGSDPDGIAGDLNGTLSNGGTNHATSIALEGGFLGGSGTDTPDAMAGGAVGNVGAGLFDGIFILLPQP